MNYPAFLTNDTANTFLANGQAQWGSQFIPSIKQFYLAKNPDYHYWFPPVANVTLFPNLTNPLLKNLAVRQAMSYAINRPKASTIGEYGYEPASNQAGIVTPTFSAWLDSSQAAAYGNNYAYNPAKAISILEHAGFKRGSNGIFQTASGKPLSFTVLNNGGFSDWVAAMQTIAADLKAVGIQLTPDNVAYSTWQTDTLHRQVRPCLLRRDRRAVAVLRAAAVALLGQLRADRHRRRVQLRAVQQPGHRRADQRVLRHGEPGDAALDRRPAAEGHAQRRCRSSRSPRPWTGSSTTPAASAAGRLSRASTRSRPSTTTPTGARC